MSKYYLTKHTFICLVGEYLVFLDLKQDMYSCLYGEQVRILRSYLSEEVGSEKTGGHSQKNQKKLQKHAQDLISEMLSNELLTSDPNKGKPTTFAKPKTPSIDLTGYDYGKKPRIQGRHIILFLRACLVTSFRLKFLPLYKVAKTIESRKHQHPKSSENLPLEEVRGLVEIFKTLQPLFFAAKNHCLFDSCALIQFLSYFDIYPDWVFGVKMNPFGAHCWAQFNDIILNDSVDHITFYTPIMAI